MIDIRQIGGARSTHLLKDRPAAARAVAAERVPPPRQRFSSLPPAEEGRGEERRGRGGGRDREKCDKVS